MDTANLVVGHYRHGGLLATLLERLARIGKDPDRLQPDDLMGIDELHAGGMQATRDLVARLNLRAGMHVLDIGSGLGGVARHLALAHACRVTGIDLTADYVATARDLSRRMGLQDRVDFRHGSALDLPFLPDSFDGATMLHVGMNIEDKVSLFAGVHRVLRPGAMFGIYDIMRFAEGAFDFPLPWATEPRASFVETPGTYRAALARAGFTLVAERDRVQFTRDLITANRERIAQSGPPPLGLDLVMGPTAGQRLGNFAAMLDRGLIGPVEMLASC